MRPEQSHQQVPWSAMTSGLRAFSNSSHNETKPPLWSDQTKQENQRFLGVQLAVSVTFGLCAFLAFCALRPRWTQLYNARKKQSQSAARLPDLPKSFFGWIPVLYNISREEVLVAAGLDAFAFLSFFRYAIKYLSITLFFALTVVLPVNYTYTGECLIPGWCPQNGTNSTNGTTNATFTGWTIPAEAWKEDKHDKSGPNFHPYGNYLWMYVVFTWLFTAIAFYLLVEETKYIIHTRQAYLGTQNTITDRTIRLSGIPANLRSEEKLKAFIEELGIGKVDSVILCRNWKRLDQLIEDRMQCLRSLETYWAVYLGHAHPKRADNKARRAITADENEEETTALLTQDEIDRSRNGTSDRKRPLHTIRHGFLRLNSRKVDAIDYYEEKLRRYNDKIVELREQEYAATPLAFVTMESTVACQMAIQAKLDPVPGRLLASPAPPPADVVWQNTYLSRNNRMARSWTIMLVVGFLTIFWAVLLVPPATILSNAVTDKFFPGLKNNDTESEKLHPIATPLIKTTLPTLYFTLLSVGVPYLYDWMSNQQGMTSQTDVELSVVSKNFFFVFFNLFVIFTVFSSVGQFYDIYEQLKDVLRDASVVAFLIFKSINRLWQFYANLIILQGFGLLPFRLLEFGAVACYPFYLLAAKTPRDHAELAKAPVFQYGFFLPQSMLIFVVCIVYSILPTAWLIIFFGLIYFIIGHFIYKYQLLYAMEHRQHSTGRVWPMICNRVILGLIIFHLAMAGFLAAYQALTAALFIAPLVFATIWFAMYFQRTYFPLMYFIALRSIDKNWHPPLPEPSESPWDLATDRGRAVDTHPETGVRYMNPNLTQPLEKLWVRKTVNNAHSDNPV